MDVRVETVGVTLPGILDVPASAVGVVVFAHGSGSSRLSPRNAAVAAALRGVGLATLLFDLLTADEEVEDAVTRHLRFDIELLTGRLAGACAFVGARPDTAALPLGLFGASTGAAAALRVAAEGPDVVRAVVSRGGRPDLATDALERVRAPTLLLVGERDETVLELNRWAAERLRCEAQVDVVPRATHLFAEPGALEEVSRRAGAWFRVHLPSRPEAPP